MKRSPSPTWAPRFSYSDALVNDLCAVAIAAADREGSKAEQEVRNLRQWQEQGLLEPARPGQRIRTWRLREPWQQWVLGQPLQRE
jgi:hypothetical protein